MSSSRMMMVDVNACSSYLSFLKNAAMNGMTQGSGEDLHNSSHTNGNGEASSMQYNFSALRRNSNNQRRLPSLHNSNHDHSEAGGNHLPAHHEDEDEDDGGNMFHSWLDWSTSSCMATNPCMTFSATSNFDDHYNGASPNVDLRHPLEDDIRALK